MCIKARTSKYLGKMHIKQVYIKVCKMHIKGRTSIYLGFQDAYQGQDKYIFRFARCIMHIKARTSIYLGFQDALCISRLGQVYI